MPKTISPRGTLVTAGGIYAFASQVADATRPSTLTSLFPGFFPSLSFFSESIPASANLPVTAGPSFRPETAQYFSWSDRQRFDEKSRIFISFIPHCREISGIFAPEMSAQTGVARPQGA